MTIFFKVYFTKSTQTETDYSSTSSSSSSESRISSTSSAEDQLDQQLEGRSLGLLPVWGRSLCSPRWLGGHRFWGRVLPDGHRIGVYDIRPESIRPWVVRRRRPILVDSGKEEGFVVEEEVRGRRFIGRFAPDPQQQVFPKKERKTLINQFLTTKNLNTAFSFLFFKLQKIIIFKRYSN